jgi:hypothetical protein
VRKHEDVFWFYRRAEGSVRQVIDLVSYVITLVLEIPKARMPAAPFEERVAELRECFANQRSLMLEQLIEPPLAWNQAQLQALTTPQLRVGESI